MAGLLSIPQLGVPGLTPTLRAVWILLAGLSLCGLCLGLRLEWAWLARIGTASYAIYLFHVFFTAASRIALEKAGLDVFLLQVTLGLLLGLLGQCG